MISGFYSLGPLTSTFRSPLPAFLVSTLKSPTCFTLMPDGWRPRPVALHAPGTQAGVGERHHTWKDDWLLKETGTDIVRLEPLTRPHVDDKGALGDSDPAERDGDRVRAGLGRPVGAAVHAVALVLHHHLHAVLTSLWVSDHGGHVSCTGSCRRDVRDELYLLNKGGQFGSVMTPRLSATSLTCSVDVKVGGFVGDVAQRFDSRALGRDLGGVAQCLVHVHFKWTLGNLLACKQHRHLGNQNKIVTLRQVDILKINK